MQRRTNAFTGWVKFPVNNPLWRNSYEGGMIVKLVVIDPREYDKKAALCVGAEVQDVLNSTFTGDDLRDRPLFDGDYTPEGIRAHEAEEKVWQSYHFPSLSDESNNDISRYMSRSYLSVTVMGSSGWSGFNDEKGHWQCSFDDLSSDGQALYDLMKSLHPDCDIHLLTFLDT